MKNTTISGLLLAGLCGLAINTQAAGLGDALRGQIGGAGGSGGGASALGGALGGGADMSALSALGLTGSGTANVTCETIKFVYLSRKDTKETIRQVVGNNGALVALCGAPPPRGK